MVKGPFVSPLLGPSPGRGSFWAILLALGFIARPLPLDARPDALIRASEALEAWNVEAAEAFLHGLDLSQPEVLLLRGQVLFHKGEYNQAVSSLEQALAVGLETPKAKALLSLIQSTSEVTRGFRSFPTPQGHFVIRVQPGKDELLVPYAAEALEKAYTTVSSDLRFAPPGQLVVEIYPHVRNLSDVTPLTHEEIETSGTIALCKYNRLMITSPRAMARGYSWLDTLAHEFVHYVISRRTTNKVPIWIHEGLAKFEEARWRSPPGGFLNPTSASLLKKALEQDKLISFEQMHPSMAKLPSQEATSLAFAEVLTIIQYLHQRTGYDGINRLLDLLTLGRNDKEAMAMAAGFDTFDEMVRQWKAYLKIKDLLTAPIHEMSRLVFDKEKEKGEELAAIRNDRAKKHAHLGDLLLVRKRFKAAALELEKASALSDDPNPVVQNWLAVAYLESSMPLKAVEALKEVRTLYPGLVNTVLNLGRAYFAMGDRAMARKYLEKALGINPFDPEIHLRLLPIYEELGEGERAERERRALHILGMGDDLTNEEE